MDAPTTTSADNGTSGDSAGSGWFAPRRAPSSDSRPASGTPGSAAASASRDRISPPSRSLASIRPVGSGAARPAPPRREGPADHDSPAEAIRRQPAPVDEVPDAFQPRPRESRDTEGPVSHPAEGPVSHPQFHELPLAPERGTDGPASEAAAAAAVRSAVARPESVQRDAPAGEAAALPPEAPASGVLPPEAPAPQPVAAPADTTAPMAEAAVPVAGPEASPDAILIRRTLAEIAPVADQVTSYFYALLFVRHPDLRGLFPAAMDAQRDRLLKALLTAAEHMDSPAVLTDYLRQLGRGHRKYGTQATHYPAVGEALIGALIRYASTTWDDETEGAWVRTYTTISQIMIDAAAENEQHAPAWWQAEVVSHELRTPDIAVITVRPDQPYPFLAGQYTSLETPWWPRVWRHYSFASAPRPDGLLAFHVKAVPAGWVSNALVHHASPGDVLRLGPPAGSMTVDHSSDSGLLCLGGGTGIAPIKALVEDVAEHGHRRPVEVFYGARSDQDLYDIDTMLRLQSVHPWLAVRPVVAEGPSLGLTGQLPEAVRDHGPWHEYDAYLSGPPGMIRSSLDALRGAGIPSERIRHDSLDVLVGAVE
ncbi:globin domain-containing protein [Streptomyces sp. NPDC051569]|uniref:globin domain-containing protein n=1 Tax=Streptomyces sp. NPDC051569 TaxID=3365661 RepID=UPI0037AB4BB0